MALKDFKKIQQKKWIQLEPTPVAVFKKPMLINDNQIIISPHSHEQTIMYSYSIKKDKWIESISYPENNAIYGHTASFNKNNQTIYIHTERQMMIIELDTNNKKITFQLALVLVL